MEQLGRQFIVVARDGENNLNTAANNEEWNGNTRLMVKEKMATLEFVLNNVFLKSIFKIRVVGNLCFCLNGQIFGNLCLL